MKDKIKKEKSIEDDKIFFTTSSGNFSLSKEEKEMLDKFMNERQ